MVSADVVVAEDDATARQLASPYGLWVRSIRTGGGRDPVPDARSRPPRTRGPTRTGRWSPTGLDTQFVGSPQTVARAAARPARVTGADELLITTITHDHADRVRSLRAARQGMAGLTVSLLSSPPRDGTGSVDLSGLTVVPVRRPWRWVATAAAAVLAAQLAHGLATNPGWDWATFAGYFFERTIMEALLVTLGLTFAGAVLGFLGGIVLAAMRLSRNPVLQVVSWTYVWVFRSIPLIVQLLFWANLGYLYRTLQVGVPFGPGFAEFSTLHLVSSLGAALLGLSLHEAAYAAEIVRSGVISVDQGQREAAAALGIPRGRQFRRILLPQAMRAILPSAANELVNLLKSTSVVYVLAIGELFYQVQVVYGRNGRVVPLLMVATVWYVVLTALLSILQFYVERHYARGALRTMPLTPLQRLRAGLSGAGSNGSAR